MKLCYLVAVLHADSIVDFVPENVELNDLSQFGLRFIPDSE